MKETYICEKRPMFAKRDPKLGFLLQIQGGEDASDAKRDLYMRKETQNWVLHCRYKVAKIHQTPQVAGLFLQESH